MKHVILALVTVVIFILLYIKIFPLFSRAINSAPQKMEKVLAQRERDEAKILEDPKKPEPEKTQEELQMEEFVAQIFDLKGKWRHIYTDNSALDKDGKLTCNAAMKYLSQRYCYEAANWYRTRNKEILTAEQRQKLRNAVKKNAAQLRRRAPEFYQYVKQRWQDLKQEFTPEKLPDFPGDKLTEEVLDAYLNWKKLCKNEPSELAAETEQTEVADDSFPAEPQPEKKLPTDPLNQPDSPSQPDSLSQSDGTATAALTQS